jgi:hypothetical protein
LDEGCRSEAEGWLYSPLLVRACLTARYQLVALATYLRLRLLYQLVALATYLPKGYLAKPRLRLRYGISWSLWRPISQTRYQLVAIATYLADSVALILRLGHETRCLYAALPVEAAAADASF